MVIPRKPACFKASTLGHGYCSLRSTSAARGAMISRASLRARFCRSCWVGFSVIAIFLKPLSLVTPREPYTVKPNGSNKRSSGENEDEVRNLGLRQLRRKFDELGLEPAGNTRGRFAAR